MLDLKFSPWIKQNFEVKSIFHIHYHMLYYISTNKLQKV